ncbi:MAG TPA: TusE/DsrC/DsvC family sulfur relay protein [Candidatus Omnitrophota bacterium]|nr:TusE/DsrC/DsvC family sulfur relay protein [Candidatus Omnitrophota bacterium]
MGYADLEKTGSGYLCNTDDWNEQVAAEIAAAEGLGTLTQRHWDLLNYLRDEFFNNGGNQPNERAMVKAMTEQWGGSVSTKDLYDLFPMQPSKQATKVAGLPETKRKGGY